MKRKLFFNFFLIFLIVILGSQLVAAQPPFISGDFTDGFLLETPPTIRAIELNQDYFFHVHVYNISTGYIITPTQASCLIHVYNPVGSHIVEQEMGADGNGLEFDLTVKGGNFTEVGAYGYVIGCNDSRIGGVIVDGFNVYSTTVFYNNTMFHVIILILSLGVIIFGLYMKDAPITILGSFGLYFLGIYILFYGINGVKDPITTWAAGIITLGLAMYISTKSAHELITS